MLPSETTRGCVLSLPKNVALWSSQLSEYPVQEHLRTIFRGVHEDAEWTARRMPENTEPCDDHNP